MKLSFFVVAALLSACSSAPITTTHPLDSPNQYLVTDGTTSALILDGPKGFEVVAKRDGGVVSSGKEIWLYEALSEDQPEADCDCFMAAFNEGAEPSAECTKTVKKPYISLTRLRDSKVIRPFPSWSSPDSESGTSFSLNGVVENHVIVEACGSAYSCGAAHPSGSCEVVAINLSTGEPTKIDSLAPNVDLKKAWAAILEANPDIGAECPEDATCKDFDSNEVSVTSVRTRFSGSAAFVEALVTTPACYACSDGKWSSYTVGTWQAVSASEELPAPVAAYFSASKSSPSWTQVSSENRTAIEAAFAK